MQHLTDENADTLRAFLFRQRQSCEVCGGKEFVIGRQLVIAPALVQPVPFAIPPAGIPLVPVHCEMCGHCRFFSAAVLGVNTDQVSCSLAPKPHGLPGTGVA